VPLPYGIDGIPHVFSRNSAALDTSSVPPYPNNIVVTFLGSMIVATYDDSGQNGHIFLLISDSM
jgi:hypothetical protein